MAPEKEKRPAPRTSRGSRSLSTPGVQFLCYAGGFCAAVRQSPSAIMRARTRKHHGRTEPVKHPTAASSDTVTYRPRVMTREARLPIERSSETARMSRTVVGPALALPRHRTEEVGRDEAVSVLPVRCDVDRCGGRAYCALAHGVAGVAPVNPFNNDPLTVRQVLPLPQPAVICAWDVRICNMDCHFARGDSSQAIAGRRIPLRAGAEARADVASPRCRLRYEGFARDSRLLDAARRRLALARVATVRPPGRALV